MQCITSDQWLAYAVKAEASGLYEAAGEMLEEAVRVEAEGEPQPVEIKLLEPGWDQ